MDDALCRALRRLAAGETGLRLADDSSAAAAFNAAATRFDTLAAAAHSQRELDESLGELTQTLLGLANGTFAARASRSGRGDSLDVLAFLINSTADEVELLVRDLQDQREELRRTQGQLIHTEKLAALGRLAAAVAHEMNQPLTAVQGLTELIRLRPNERVRDVDADLETIEHAADHLARIVDDVRTFARPTSIALCPTPALQAPKKAERLLATQIKGAGVRVEWRPQAMLPPVMANSDRLEQVFVNLLRNALDAMSSADTGNTLTIRAEANDRWVTYTVDDEGLGISSRSAAKLFEPFFTTKPVGEGMGLGLSVSLGIVQDHVGEMNHAVSPTGGARFVVRIPLAREEDRHDSSADHR